jgi:hypothetical protein
MSDPVAIVDSDSGGNGATQDEQLITPAMDLSTATTATLQFDQYFKWYSLGQNEIADVDVRSALTGGTWVNVLRQQGASSSNPDHRMLDLTSRAAGAPDVQVRFHYYNAAFEWFWQVDNVHVDTTAPGPCHQNICSAQAIAKPVPDGSFGVAMTASRVDPTATTIDLTWDVATCSSTDHHVLYGPLAGVTTLTLEGSVCDLGATGTATWNGVPAEDLWFVIAGDDGATTEGSWGKDSAGQERGGATASAQCGTTVRDNSGTCP